MQTNYKYQSNFNLNLDVPPVKQGILQFCNISLDMYGSGEGLEKMIQLVNELGVDDIVNFKGNV